MQTQTLREVILKNKLLPFGNFSKGGGVQTESKSFGVVFVGFLLDNFIRAAFFRITSLTNTTSPLGKFFKDLCNKGKVTIRLFSSFYY